MEDVRGIVAEVGEDGADSHELFEMANLYPKNTGLPFVVWISYRGGAQHDVRVKVSRGPTVLPREMVSVAIRPSVRVVEGDLSASELAALTAWVDLNRDVIVKYWDGEFDTKDALDALRVPKADGR